MTAATDVQVTRKDALQKESGAAGGSRVGSVPAIPSHRPAGWIWIERHNLVTGMPELQSWPAHLKAVPYGWKPLADTSKGN